MAAPIDALKTNPSFTTDTFESIQYSNTEREEIANKIKTLVADRNNQTVFFEYNSNEKLYYLIQFGVRQISFSKQDAITQSTQQAAKKLLSQAFNKISHLVLSKNFTIIDGVYNRIWTTSIQVHENRNFHPKVPFKTTCYQGRISGMDITDDFIRDTFDNLTDKR